MHSRLELASCTLILLLAGCATKAGSLAHSVSDAGAATHDAAAQRSDASVSSARGAADGGGGAADRDAGTSLGGDHDAGSLTHASDEDAGPSGCSPACAQGSVCVKDQTIGGAQILPDDAGVCPAQRVIVSEAPGLCSPAPNFHCAQLPSGCSPVRCTCAQALCTGGCTDAGSALVQCLLLAP